MTKTSKIRQALLSIAIALIFSMLIGFGISTFYEAPERDDDCYRDIKTKTTCESNGGEWHSHEDISGKYICDKSEGEGIILNCVEDTKEYSGWCEESCGQEYQEEWGNYNKNVFILTTIIALIGLVVGGVFLSVESVGSGFMGGSILTFLYGTLRYWEHASDILRVVILALSLGVLVWLGYTKLKN